MQFLSSFQTLNRERTVYPVGKDNDKLAIHSFIHANYSTNVKEYLFDAAFRTGKKLIRFDFPITIIKREEEKFSWEMIDENVDMADKKNLEIVGTLGYSAPWISADNATKNFQGPIDQAKYEQYADYVRQTVRRYPQIKYWELWNEPNNKALYDTNPSEFAGLMRIMYQAVKEANSNAEVLFPGVIFNTQKDFEWVKAVLTDSKNPGKSNYDIANIHIRGDIKNITNDTKIALEGFNQFGKKDAPLWITEFGYPADPKYQYEEKYRGQDKESGEKAQAQFYEEVIPLLLSMGIDKIFVTLRDIESEDKLCLVVGSPFCSEGLVTFSKIRATGTDRPAMKVFQDF